MNRPSQRVDSPILFRQPAGSDAVIVAFGARGQRTDRTPYAPLLGQIPDVSKIVLRDPSSRWFQAGVPGAGETLEQIVGWLDREIEEIGASRVVTFGSSMGGYAAILFGCLLGVARVVAFAPQTILDPHLGPAPPEGTVLHAPDLKPLIAQSAGVEVDLVIGWDNLVDVVHAQRITDLPPVRVFAVNSASHALIADLHRAGNAVPFLTEPDGETVAELARRDPPIHREQALRIEKAVRAGMLRDWQTARTWIEPVADRHPQWAAPNLHLGKALLELGEPDRAEIALRRALEIKASYAYLGKALKNQGKTEEAERELREALAQDPRWAEVMLDLAELVSQRDEGEAKAIAADAEQIVRRHTSRHPRNPIWSHALTRSLKLQGRLDEAMAATLRTQALMDGLAALPGHVPPAHP